jgi:rhodanese-related sulfurtransferase
LALALCPQPLRAETPNIFQATLGDAGKTGEVSTEQMRQIVADKSAIVLDTRSRAEFDAGHIPGAVNLAAAQSEQLAAVTTLVNGDKAKALVLYCNGPYCQASRRLGEQLADSGFGNVRRYQLGIPIWRALGGPVEVELAGIKRVFGTDRTAIFFDVRPLPEFAAGTLPGAVHAPVEDIVTGKAKMALPEDDFNRRIVLIGNGADARKLADFMGKRPWHNVSYYPGDYAALAAALN